MLINSIIPSELSIYNFFEKLKFNRYLSKPQLGHMESMVRAMLSKEYSGKISDVSEHSSKHRTSISRFLSRDGKNSWNENYLTEALKKLTVDLIWKRSKESGEPICFIIDDTISELATVILGLASQTGSFIPEGMKG